MIKNAILGIIQGIAEWLPVSSEGAIILTLTNLFHHQGGLEEAVKIALFLHLGTFLAALIYFRTKVIEILAGILQWRQQPEETKKLIIFLAVSTIISGILGLLLIKWLGHLTSQTETSGRTITIFIGCLLLGTAYLDLKAKGGGYKSLKDITFIDGIILGIVQGFAALPGFSRSGLTVSFLMLRKFDKTWALQLSFLMSLPIVLAGNIILNFEELRFSKEACTGLFTSFIFGLGTIHILLKIAEKIKFGFFLFGFGIITILSAFI